MYQNLKKNIRHITYSYPLMREAYFKLNNFKTKTLSFLDDETFAAIKYWEATGKKLNLQNPKYFNEKLWWLKINNRQPLMTQCSDKVEVRDYIIEIGLGYILNDIQGVYSKAEDIPFNVLNGKYFIKCNHVSGINTIYDSDNIESFNYERFKKEFNKALSRNYFGQSREWNYKNIKPKILIERFIESTDNLLDYRFFCFNGKVKLIFVDIDTALSDGKHNPEAKRNIYNKEFVLQDFTVARENFDPKLVQKPSNLEEMINVAEKISEPFIFCRVDLYNNKGEIKFGEITFYPGGASQQFSSEQADLKVSGWLNI